MDENMIRLLLKDQADTGTTTNLLWGRSRSAVEGGRVQLRRCGYRMVSVDDKEWVNYRLGQICRKWLKLNLQRELLVSKPTTLSDAFSLALIIKARLDDQAAPVTIQASKIVTNFWNQKQATPRVGIASSVVNVNKPPLLPMPPQMTSNVNTKPLAIKWKFLTVRQERLNKCVRGHKCPGKFLLLMADEDDDTVQESEPDTLDTTESHDISILNSLIGQGSPRSLQLWEIIGIGDVYELVDNGGSHTFVQPKVGELMRRQAMVMGWPYQWVGGSPEEAMWEWMSDSQSAYSLYHLKGKAKEEKGCWSRQRKSGITTRIFHQCNYPSIFGEMVWPRASGLGWIYIEEASGDMLDALVRQRTSKEKENGEVWTSRSEGEKE
ncbi:hypothetical protein Tco_0020378 [Tanacetum coccineum]